MPKLESEKASELALEAYKLLVDLMKHEEQMLWNRNQVFLIMNGAMVTALGLAKPVPTSSFNSMPKEFSAAVCAIGFFLTLLWLTTIVRSESFYNYWTEQAKWIEREYLYPIQIMQLGDDYFSKGEVKLGLQKLVLSKIARILRIYQALVITALAFMLIWIALLYFSIS